MVLINCQLTELIKSKLFFRGPHESWAREQGDAGKVWCQVCPSRESKREFCPAFAQPLPWGLLGDNSSVGVGYPVESCGKLPGGHLLPASPHRNAAPLDAVLSHPELLCPAGTGCPVPGRGRLPGHREAAPAMAGSGSPRAALQPWERPGPMAASGTAALAEELRS